MSDEPACHDSDDAAIELVIEGRPRPVGTIVVARLLPSAKRRMIGPFIFIDHMGPIEIPPDVGFDVRPHPHIGLSTVTYFLAGENVHRDSLGTVQTNVPGDVNIMTAGRGVVHSERADPAWRARGGVMHGLQIWVALPEANEDDPPSFAHHPAATLPVIAHGRVLIGTAFGATSPIVHPSKPLLVDLVLAAGTRVVIPDALERGIVVIEGEVEIGGQVVAADRLAVIAPGEHVVRAVAASRILVVGGAPLGARLIDWNFVASSKERIDRARAGWQAQTFPLIPTDHDEHIPYPELHTR
jgi:redox-sensitive bicupin YhaK (pirin superfamily)